jgi:hypothetical protein
MVITENSPPANRMPCPYCSKYDEDHVPPKPGICYEELRFHYPPGTMVKLGPTRYAMVLEITPTAILFQNIVRANLASEVPLAFHTLAKDQAIKEAPIQPLP